MPGPRAVKLAAALAATLATAAGVAGCGSGGADKAGGTRTPTVLRLASYVRSTDLPAHAVLDYFVREVDKLSGGRLRVSVTFLREGPDPPDAAYEARIARSVRSGRFDLGWIGAPAWDELGVTTLQALQTPFLVTDYALLGRIATGPLARQMLGGLTRAGVVGLALIPGVLSHPAGLRHGFVAAADYAHARIGNIPSRTTDAVVRALGGVPVHVSGAGALLDAKVDAEPTSVEATEPVGSCSVRCAWLIGSTVTVNVTLFASAETLVANPRGLARLDRARQAVLRAAAEQTVVHSAAAADAESAGVREFCKNNGHAVVATPRQLAELEQASAPVTAQLRRDPQTAALIASIRSLKGSMSPVPPATVPSGCGPARAEKGAPGLRRPPSVLNGTYRYVVTQRDALTRGDPSDKTPSGLAQYPQVITQILRDGTWLGGGDCSCEANGRYTITGNHLDFDWVPVGYELHFTYSRDRDGTLHLIPVPPMENGDRFIFSTEPWRRIGPPIVRAR